MLCLLFFLISVDYRAVSDGLELDFNFIATPETEFSFPGGLYNNPVGAPNLPSRFFYIGIPQEGGVKVEVVEEELKSYQGIIRPVGRFSFELTSFEEDPAIYQRDRFYPELFSISEPMLWRDLRVVVLRVNPVRYNPVLRQVLVSSRLKLRLIFERRPEVVRRSSQFDNIYQDLILNYDQVRDWRFIRNPIRVRSFFDMPFWYKVTVDSCGLYRIDYDLLKGVVVDPGRIDPRTFRLYVASFDTLGGNTIDTTLLDGLVEVPILVYGEEDGRFDRGDYILFYGFSASRIEIMFPETLSYINDPFERFNYYWLTYGGRGGKRFSRVDGKFVSGETMGRFYVPVHYEEERENPARSGLRWIWQTMSVTESGSWSFPIYHPNASGEGEIKVNMLTLGRSFKIQLYYNDSLFCDTIWSYWDLFLRKQINFYGDSGTLRIDLSRNGLDTFTSYFKYVELLYPELSELKQPLHSFVVTPGVYQYEVSGVKSPPVVLDITDPRDPLLLYNLEVVGESLRFAYRVDSIALVYISDLGKVRKPVLEGCRVGQLRQERVGCDYLILTSDLFYDELRPLLDLRRREYSCRMVKLSDIYNNFGFGKRSPGAIKYFLYYVYRNWEPMPKYLLFVGDGNYDYKNNLNVEKPNNFFPPYECGNNINEPQSNLCYDDWFVTFQGIPEMIIGRLNVRNKSNAREVVKKILDYNRKGNLGLWAKRILLVGDDEWGPDGRFEWGGFWKHSADCESLLKFIPDSICDITKIYLNIYPNENGNKPKSRIDFINAMNYGALCGAFYGHGRVDKLAHEGALFLADVNLVNNGSRNFFFYYGTCGAGRFDDSKYESLCEEFVNRPYGAIGTYGATRGTAPEENVPLGNYMFDNIFNKDLTIGECCYNAKRSSGASANYCLFGDPAVRLTRPYGGVRVSTKPDTLKPLSRGLLQCSEPKFFVSATVRDSLNGPIHYKVRDERGNLVEIFNFNLQGQPFFRGASSQESIYFVAPQVAVQHLPVLRFSIYNNLKSIRLDSVPLRGLAIPSGDVQPPKVEFYAAGKKLQDGDWVNKDLILIGIIEDESGINLMDSPDNERQGFGLYVNENKTEVIDLRNYFNYDLDSYQRGRFIVELALPDKEDTVTVFVSDNNYNRAEVKLGLRVAVDEHLVVEDFLIYPNPIEDDGYFTFNLSVDAVVDITIYTVAGRLVRRFDKIGVKAGFNQVWWNGLDNLGNKLANGVYLVKLKAQRRQDGAREAVSKIEKFIVAHEK